ncbi:hypothetical protein [Kocuria sp. TGY1127_2]|uniref:hypothetical protein n=1 Tax=Kocuria sp. TGY1127_2 TaxID=2711328 RepID=UPI0015B8EB6B|nr:hypothetical protein [Kocuria sp. TGY1127_2]
MKDQHAVDEVIDAQRKTPLMKELAQALGVNFPDLDKDRQDEFIARTTATMFSYFHTKVGDRITGEYETPDDLFTVLNNLAGDANVADDAVQDLWEHARNLQAARLDRHFFTGGDTK